VVCRKRIETMERVRRDLLREQRNWALGSAARIVAG
jgi:hypothetical protein